jgi:hypothetical protein
MAGFGHSEEDHTLEEKREQLQYALGESQRKLECAMRVNAELQKLWASERQAVTAALALHDELRKMYDALKLECNRHIKEKNELQQHVLELLQHQSECLRRIEALHTTALPKDDEDLLALLSAPAT